MKKTFLAPLISLLIFFMLGATLVLAEAGNPGIGGGGTLGVGGAGNPPSKCNSTICIENPFRVGGNLFDLLRAVINDIILPIGGILAVLAFIYSGFQYVMAQGDTKKISDAHNALLYTAIGTALLLGSWTLANVIGNTIDKLKS